MPGLKRLLLPLGGILLAGGFTAAQLPAPSWIRSRAKSPRHPSGWHREAKGARGSQARREQPRFPVPILIEIPFQSPPSAFLCVFSFSRELPSSSPLPPGASPLLCPPASPFLSALYKQSASVSGGKKSCIMQMGKSREEISHSENPHSGPAPRFPWRGQSLLEPGLHTDERGDEISTQAHR